VSARLRPANSIVGYALTGGDAHVATRSVFDGLDWRFAGARVKGSPHTLYELLNHMIFWQEGVVAFLDGGHRKCQCMRRTVGLARQSLAHAQNGHRQSGDIRLVSPDSSVPPDELARRERREARANWTCLRRSARTTVITPDRRRCFASCYASGHPRLVDLPGEAA
jgi:hypothetical protein